MYEGDTYKLVDGLCSSAGVSPLLGVKQGCPLSPLLFALYLNDFDAQCTGLWHGIELAEGGRAKLSQLFFADDLCLFSHTAEGLQTMLDGLECYSKEKGLTVNVTKSKIVVFLGRAPLNTHLRYKGKALGQEQESKYLGVVFHQGGSMGHASEQWSRVFAAAAAAVREKAEENGLS